MSEEEDFDQFFGEEEINENSLSEAAEVDEEEEDKMSVDEPAAPTTTTTTSISIKSIKTPTDRGYIVSPTIPPLYPFLNIVPSVAIFVKITRFHQL